MITSAVQSQDRLLQQSAEVCALKGSSAALQEKLPKVGILIYISWHIFHSKLAFAEPGKVC